jgi:hypothetical protein
MKLWASTRNVYTDVLHAHQTLPGSQTVRYSDIEVRREARQQGIAQIIYTKLTSLSGSPIATIVREFESNIMNLEPLRAAIRLLCILHPKS